MLVLRYVSLGNGRRKHEAKQRRGEENNREYLAETPFALDVDGFVLKKTDGGPKSTRGDPMYLIRRGQHTCLLLFLRLRVFV